MIIFSYLNKEKLGIKKVKNLLSSFPDEGYCYSTHVDFLFEEIVLPFWVSERGEGRVSIKLWNVERSGSTNVLNII